MRTTKLNRIKAVAWIVRSWEQVAVGEILYQVYVMYIQYVSIISNFSAAVLISGVSNLESD